MAAATIEIDEKNGSGAGTVTDGITKSDFGSTDAVNLDPVAYPIAQSSCSFQKIQQYHVTNIGTSSAIQNCKVWTTAAPATGWTHYTNAHTTQGTYDNKKRAYASPGDPVSTDQSGGDNPNAMPNTSAPSTANLGIGGTLTPTTAKITTGGARGATTCTDWLVHQLKCATPTVGGSLTVTYQYDEVA